MLKIFVGLLAAAFSLLGQDWTPKRIVAITRYVPLALQARISGEVRVKCHLDSNGSVVTTEGLSGHPLLRKQAGQNASQWKFERRSAEGKADTVILTYEYVLEGESQGYGSTIFIVDLPDRIQVTSPAPMMNP